LQTSTSGEYWEAETTGKQRHSGAMYPAFTTPNGWLVIDFNIISEVELKRASTSWFISPLVNREGWLSHKLSYATLLFLAPIQISLWTATYLYKPFPQLPSAFRFAQNTSPWSFYLQDPPQTACITILVFP
jgi:hypothetical protein